MIVGERMLVPCVGGPTAWRAVAFPPPFEVEAEAGIYMLVDDGEPSTWHYEFVGAGGGS